MLQHFFWAYLKINIYSIYTKHLNSNCFYQPKEKLLVPWQSCSVSLAGASRIHFLPKSCPRYFNTMVLENNAWFCRARFIHYISRLIHVVVCQHFILYGQLMICSTDAVFSYTGIYWWLFAFFLSFQITWTPWKTVYTFLCGLLYLPSLGYV